MITTAKRLDGIGEYYFSQKLREIDMLNKQGKQIINLGIGSPDLPPHPTVIATLQEESAKADVHAYQSYKGSPVLRKAIADWYAKWYAVTLQPDTEILPLIGSKEGIMHICMTYLNEGDIALIPNPGYPTYASAVRLAGGKTAEYKLEEKNDWAPDFAALENIIHSSEAGSVKLFFLNYPNMPTGQLPSVEVFEQSIAFAQKHDLLIVHDNPYSFILNDSPMSLLSIAGAMDVVIELNSLSKASNMAGWRVGMMIAAKERIDEVLKFKSNMDSGMFLPVQLAAAKALNLDKSWYDEVNAIYAKRRDKVYALLNLLQCSFSTSQAGMFVFAKVPAQFESGYTLSDKVLYDANVFITPGGIFGSAGHQYVRVSLCSSEAKFEEAINRIKQSL
jgi:aspartate/methionine/tyrosine aminotransferase